MEFIENIDVNEYKEFTNKHKKSHFLQSYEWAMFCSKAKRQIPHFIGLKNDNNELVATALILEKKTPLGYSYGYSPRGFILDYNNKELIKTFTNFIKEYMQKNKYIYIKFDPDIKYQDIDDNAQKKENGINNYELFDYMLSLDYKHTGFYKLYDGNQPRYTFRLDLSQSKEEIDASISKSFMKSVKRSYNYDLIIDNKYDVKSFYRLMQNNSTKNDFSAHSEEYYQIFSDSFNKENIKYFNAYIEPNKLLKKLNNELITLKDNLEKHPKKEQDILSQIKRVEKDINIFKGLKDDKIMVCSLICVYTKNRAWSLFIGSDEIANLTFAVSRCYYEAILDAKNHNYEFFDLFGTTGEPNTTYKNLAKLHDFKRKFGGEYIEFIGEFDLINKKLMYKILPILLDVYRKIRK